MENICLVGIQHHIEGNTNRNTRLMNDSSEKLFIKDILPLITDNSILFVEGCWNGTFLPTQPEYRERLREISKELLESGKKPTLRGIDPRPLQKLLEAQKFINTMGETMNFCQNWITVAAHPNTLEEMIEICRKGDIPHKFRLPISPKIRRMASIVARYNDQFTTEHIAQMTEAAKVHDRCFLIAGLAHPLDIHSRTGWKIKILWNGYGGSIGELFRAYLNTHTLPRAIRGW